MKSKSAAENGPACYGQPLKEYKSFLQTLAVSLGLGEKESLELVNDVCRSGEKNFSYQKNKFATKIHLSKILVRKCIFRISGIMFSEAAGDSTNSFQVVGNYLNSLSLYKIPFSFRTVYILFHSIGFTESEIAEILNITPIQVRERLSKARTIIKTISALRDAV